MKRNGNSFYLYFIFNVLERRAIHLILKEIKKKKIKAIKCSEMILTLIAKRIFAYIIILGGNLTSPTCTFFMANHNLLICLEQVINMH